MLTRALALRHGSPQGPLLYWGKIIGTLAGAATLKPWFVLLGLFFGHQVDRFLIAQMHSFESNSSLAGRLPDEYVQPLFQTMGHLAKVDGRVSQAEIRAARGIMHRLGLGPAKVRKAIDWFEDGKRASFPVLQTVRHVRRVAARRVELRLLFVRLVLEVVLAKDRMQQKERALIWTICTEFDIGRVELAQLEAMIRAQKGFKHSPAGNADAQRVKKAYETLGVDQSATNDEVVKAYRRAINKSHPDKIASNNPDKAEIAAAEKRTREVRSAYEMLKSRRSIR